MSASSIAVPANRPPASPPAFVAAFPSTSAKSDGPVPTTGRDLDIISARTRLQAYNLTFIDAFHLIAWGCVVMRLVTLVLRMAPISFGPLEMLQQELPPTKGEKA